MGGGMGMGMGGYGMNMGGMGMGYGMNSMGYGMGGMGMGMGGMGMGGGGAMNLLFSFNQIVASVSMATEMVGMNMQGVAHAFTNVIKLIDTLTTGYKQLRDDVARSQQSIRQGGEETPEMKEMRMKLVTLRYFIVLGGGFAAAKLVKFLVMRGRRNKVRQNLSSCAKSVGLG